MKLKLMIFCLFTALAAHAQEDPKADDIAEGLDAGAYLLYDCPKQRWSCVAKKYFDECTEVRSEDIAARKDFLRCAPIGEFPTKRSCFQRQLFMVSQNYGTRFCLGEDIRYREIRY